MKTRTGFWLLALSTSLAHAQGQPPVAPPPAVPAVTAPSGWPLLSPQQRQALAPLADSWDQLSNVQQRKWLALSRNFQKLAPDEQATLHSRMTEWAALSVKQRNQARLNYAKSKQLPADEKKAKWEAYQALSPEEKRKLAASGSPKAAGAALTVKPLPPGKLTKLPPVRVKPQPAKRDPSPSGAEQPAAPDQPSH